MRFLEAPHSAADTISHGNETSFDADSRVECLALNLDSGLERRLDG
jgi:hypothetical protein